MANFESCILYFYESQNQYLIKALVCSEKITNDQIYGEPEKVLEILTEAGFIKEEITIDAKHATIWQNALSNAAAFYNANVPKITKWYRFDSNNSSFVELVGSDFDKCEAKLKNNIYINVKEFDSFKNDEIIECIRRNSSKKKYGICYCENCNRYVIVEYLDALSMKCKRCGEKLLEENLERQYTSKSDAYAAFANEFVGKTRKKNDLNSFSILYNNHKYCLNNNDLTLLISQIASNLDYCAILVDDELGVHIKEEFVKYLICCDGEYENFILNFNAKISGQNIIKAFYIFLNSDEIKRFHSLGNVFLFFEFKGETYLFKTINEFIDLFMNQENDDDKKKLLDIFQDPNYKKYFFYPILNENHISYDTLMYLIYKKTGEFVYIAVEDDRKVYNYGKKLIIELSSYNNIDDIKRIISYFDEVSKYPEFSSIDPICFCYDSFVALSLLDQNLNKNDVYKYKGLTFSTDIKKACKDFENIIKQIYLNNDIHSKTLDLLRELLTKENMKIFFGESTESTLLNSVIEKLNDKDASLLDLYLASSEYLSFKESMFLIHGVKGTIVEIAETAIENNWINELIANYDYLKIKEHLFKNESAEFFTDIKNKFKEYLNIAGGKTK